MNYTSKILREQYSIHRAYTLKRMELTSLNITVRSPSIPDDISENIIKFIIKKTDASCEWKVKNGDLSSKIEGQIECKCFTSTGPCSFSPTSIWDVIYFLDARDWLKDKLVLYKVNLSNRSNEWKKIKVNKEQTFKDQCDQGRRPRITWSFLYPQIKGHCEKIYDGKFDDIFV